MSDATLALPEPGVVDVWSFPLEVDDKALGYLGDALDAAEHRRVAALATPALRARFVVARGTLRTALARALGTEPAALAFGYGRHGKPYLPGAPVRFNLSHSRFIGLIAICREAEVGVDVEDIPRAPSARFKVAARCFADSEGRQLQESPVALRPRRCATLWAAKEAYVKMTGEGLTRPLSSFVVDLPAGCAPALVSVDGRPSAAGPVRLHPLEVAPGAAAVLSAAADHRAEPVRALPALVSATP